MDPNDMFGGGGMGGMHPGMGGMAASTPRSCST